MKRVEAHAGSLYDFAVTNPDGFTNTQAMSHFMWSLPTFNEAAQALRDILGHDDDISFVCIPPGDGGKWIYKLVGQYDDVQPWTANRLHDAERRLRTIEHVTAPIVRATSGRTSDGKKARMLHSTARYIKEQLALLAPDADAG